MSENPRYFYSADNDAICDIYELFGFYNEHFFGGVLEKSTIQWSNRMTLCAGTCEYKGMGSCCIKLSEPLLKFRTSNELKETILHEMIHAFLFVTNPEACRTEGGHGKEFQEIMRNVNSITGLNVTVYHSFSDEVDNYRTHVWRCDGPCQHRPPYYGYVKRSMNRKPQPADPWFNDHQKTCGGSYVKISEPQKKGSRQQAQKKAGKTIQEYFEEITAQNEQKGETTSKGVSSKLQNEVKPTKAQKPHNSQNQKREKKKSSKQKSNQAAFLGQGKTIQEYLSEISKTD